MFGDGTLPDRKWCDEVEEGKQQENLSDADGWHHEDGKDDNLLRRQANDSDFLQ